MTFSLLRVLLLVLMMGSSARAEEDDDMEWLQAFSGLGPYLIASFFFIFSLHVLLYPQFATRALMKSYIKEGLRIPGHVLSCETKAGSGGEKFVVEIMYTVQEHKFANNPSMRFRHPGEFEQKKLRRRFEFNRELARGSTVEVLLPPGPNSTRSGCPTEVVEDIQRNFSTMRVVLLLIPGSILLLVSIGMGIREVHKMDDPAMGWMVFLAGLGVSEAVALLFSADQFFKAKRRRFDSAKPMVTLDQQAAARESHQISREELLDPYNIPMHEFAGHARASERQVNVQGGR